jgi:hypothetical protein
MRGALRTARMSIASGTLSGILMAAILKSDFIFRCLPRSIHLQEGIQRTSQ